MWQQQQQGTCGDNNNKVNMAMMTRCHSNDDKVHVAMMTR